MDENSEPLASRDPAHCSLMGTGDFEKSRIDPALTSSTSALDFEGIVIFFSLLFSGGNRIFVHTHLFQASGDLADTG